MKLERQDITEALRDAPFKTVFKAVVAFYIAQAVVTVTGLLILVGILWMVFG